MKIGFGSATRLEDLSGLASSRATGTSRRWPRMASVTFVIVFNLLVWGSVAYLVVAAL